VSARQAWACSLALSLSLVACGGPSRKQQVEEERHALIYALSRLDPAAPPQERADALDAVHGLPLTDKELIATREICLAAHRGLLEAHLLQAEARKAFGEAQQGGPQRTSHAAHAQKALDASTETIARARTSLDACQVHTRTLVRGSSAAK